jgi:hypothetical protein
MRIGTDENYLELERTSDPEFPYFRISVRIDEGGGVFSGSNGGVLYGGGADGLVAVQAFHELDVHEVFLDFTEGCWIKIVRHARGNLTIEFQIKRVIARIENSLRGMLEIEGESAQASSLQLCRLLTEAMD